MNSDYLKITLLTLFLDILFLILLCIRNLKILDYLFVYNVYIIHILFLISLFYDNEIMIDISHYLLFILLFISVFIIHDVYILGICLFLITTIQILWVIEGRCILNKKDEEFGYGKTISICTLLFTIVMSFVIGKKQN